MLRLASHAELHPLFEALGYVAGYLLYRRERARAGDGLPDAWGTRQDLHVALSVLEWGAIQTQGFASRLVGDGLSAPIRRLATAAGEE